MKKQISITLAAIMLAGLTACGTSTPAASSEATAPASSESEATAEEPSADSELDATVDEAEQALSDIGSIDVDKGLFDVTITFPADFATDITQEEIDQQVADGKVHSGQINEDGSVTYVMSKDQHKAIVDGISESIQSTLDGMVGTEDYPNFTAIDHNNVRKSFNSLMHKLGIAGVTPHTCRHTAATKMAASGLPPEVTKQILGHADIATTLNIYTHPDTANLVENLRCVKWA